jgi:hypothetical protein
MAANGNNVRFNLDDFNNAEDNVGNNDGLQNGENAATPVQQAPQFPIPEGVNQATANLLNMQMNMMQTLMAQMERNYQANQFNLETRLDNERRERLELAKQLENRDSTVQKLLARLRSLTSRKTGTTSKRGSSNGLISLSRQTST